MKKLLLLLTILTLGFCSCKDKHDYTPAILEISEDAFDDCFNISKYNLDHEEQITDEDKLRAMRQHKFTHVQVSYGGDVLGVWELPCSVPILDVNSSDSTYVTIVPCFKKNGQSSTIKGYGFIKSYKKLVLLKKGSTTYINKESMREFYEYHKYAKFELIEPFSSQNSFSPYNTLTSIATFDCVIDPSDPSNRIGRITLTNDSLRSTFTVATSSINFLVNYQSYLEIRYKCENDLDISLLLPAYATNYSCGGLYATDEWETAYINLDENLLNVYNSGSVHTDYISTRILLSGSMLNGQETHYEIDYVKVITGPQP